MEDDAQLIWFENEDSEAILAKYIEFMAVHGVHFSSYDICKSLFSNLKDGLTRAGQATIAWSKNIEVQEAIRQRKLYSEKPKEEKDQLKQVLKSIYEDQLLQAKDRIAAVRTAAELEGWIIKSVDKKVTDNSPPKPYTFVLKEYEDE